MKHLISHLPVDSATVRKLAGDRADWSVDRELLAGVADRVAELTWLTVEVHKKKGAKNPRPEPIRRPGQPAKPERRHASVTEMKRFFGRAS